MSDGNATQPDLYQTVYDCVKFGRMGNGLLYACVAMFLYDYCLTVYDEIRYIWKPRRISLTSVTFILARYPVFASVILILLPAYVNQRGNHTVLLSDVVTALRLLGIIASEFILAVRTWAIWEKSRIILITLTVFSVSAIVPAAVVVAKDISTARVDPVIASYSNCRMIISEVTNAYVVPYVLTIVYEGITLTSSLIRITRWRKRIPKRIRAPLLDALWRDGVFYFSWTLALSFLNIAIIVQSSSNQFRSGASELQAVMHSILSCRVVLHLAGSKVPKEINSSGCSLYTNPAIQFTTQIEFAEHDLPPRDSAQNHDTRV
ncbi:hypothetical protein BDZ89DRAFT_1160472 [Hymenopellis radicata]|nr:hypothetical protein BDZ89DRAFT_1160472 [Hymenopellis radicata]